MNGGIQPTVELATNNGNGVAYPYPIYPMMSGFGGGNGAFGFGDSSAIWILLLIALLGGFGNNGNGGGFFNGGFDNGYAWLSNGQKDIMNQTSDGFNSLHLSNQIEGIRDDVNDIQNAICNSTNNITSAISNGFYNSEISANNRQMANMQQNFDLSRQFADCCCENRLATANLNSTIISENCADRQLINEVGRDIITNQTANTQKIIDEIFRDRLDEKNDKIADLQRQLQMADLRASQIAQTAQIREGQVAEVDALYDRLNNCPVGTVPVYGRQPIFSCNNNGCGCNGGFYGNGTSF